ncbi:MAG: ABC transporter permease [Phyllobacteriaceae bacterium]|nr:ABC transporter permease [Phyllobacteriaceae bacterium]
MRPSVITATLLAPSLITIIVLLAAPMLLVVGYSFAGRDAYGGVVAGFTLQNYAEAIQPIYLPILVNTLMLAFWSTAICLLVGYPIAYFIAFKAGRYAPLLLALLLIPFWVDFLVRISAWMVLLGRNGPLNHALLSSGLIEQPVRLLGTYGAVLVGMLYAFLPSAVLPIYAALNPIDRKLLEAAADLGANPVEAFWRTTFPLSLPGVMAAILFVFVPAMGVYAIPVLLGGGKNIILGNLIVQLFLEFRNMPLGAAISVLLLCVSMAVIAFYMHILIRIEEKRA